MSPSRSPVLLSPSFCAAALGGVLYFLAYLGFGIWPLLGCFIVPLWWALERTLAERLWTSFAIGAAFGFVAFAGGHRWLLDLVGVFLAESLWLGLAIWIAYGLWFAAGFGAYAVVYRGLRRRGHGLANAAIAPWLILEWLHPLLFPVHSGAALVDVAPLVQIADLGGPLLVSALVVLVNLMIFESTSWKRRERSMPSVVWLATGLAIVGTLAYGALRSTQISAATRQASVLRVGVVQANIEPDEKLARAVLGHRKHLKQTAELLTQARENGGPDANVDLVIWPETAYAQAIRGPLPVSGRLVQQRLRIPLLFGAPLIDDAGPPPVQYNAAFLVDETGIIQEGYRKNLLIPFAERIPLSQWWSGAKDFFPHAQTFAAASETPGLWLGDWKLAVPICYEAVWPSFIRGMMNESDAHLIVTLANDAWFGDSHEPYLHLGLARMRAIEHRRYLVRATNSGISAIIDPTGRILERTGLLERANMIGEVRRLDGTTLYRRFGDWPGWLAIIWLGSVVVASTASRSLARPN